MSVELQLEYKKVQEEKRQKQIEKNKKDLLICISEAEKRIKDHWNKNCKAKGLKEDCLQDLEIVDIYIKRQKELKDECFKRYPQE